MTGEPTGQGWTQVGELAVAFGLSLLIGIEREVRQKSAGVRTYSLVGVGAALFVLVSKYGFTDVLGDHVVLDPSRVAAQIVTGVGFIGGGVIFVRRDAVRGLTTAASVWVVAAVGSAAGAGLPILAAFGTALYFVVVLGLRPLTQLVRGLQPGTLGLRVVYLDGRGLLRDIVANTTARGFAIAELATEATNSTHDADAHRGTIAGAAVDDGAGAAIDDQVGDPQARPTVGVRLTLTGHGDLSELTVALSEVDGVLAVRSLTADPEE